MNEYLSSAAQSCSDTFPLPRYLTRGHLKIEMQGERAYFYEEALPISPVQQRVMFILSRNEKYITFEQLYTKIFVFEKNTEHEPDDYEKPPDRGKALSSMENLTATVNNYCKGEIWIEFEPDKGYIMRIANTINNNGTKSGEDK